MSFTLCTSAAIIQKAGYNVSSTTATSGTLLASFCDQAEATLSMKTRYDWVTNYASVNANLKPMLADATSDLAAMKVISYDLGRYTGLGYANTMLNVLKNNFDQIVVDLREKTFQEKVVS
jgi:hypothetical protein